MPGIARRGFSAVLAGPTKRPREVAKQEQKAACTLGGFGGELAAMKESGAGFRKAVLYAGSGLPDLYPVTSAVPKALLPVYDKPLIYYSLSVLMLSGIREIALVTRSADQPAFRRLLDDGSRLGLRIEYLTEGPADGAAQALIGARNFIGHDPLAVVLADSLIYGDGLQRLLSETTGRGAGATVFAHPVGNPQNHAIVELADGGEPRSIEERPALAKSNLAITGIAFYDRQLADIVASLAAERDSLSLIDIDRRYLALGQLHVRQFGRGFAWLQTNTHAALTAAANFIETIEATHGLKIGCLEEIAYRKGFISAEQVASAAAGMNNTYGEYLRRSVLAGTSVVGGGM
jgi:glucose-1-phosphate thymidylyltransferase